MFKKLTLVSAVLLASSTLAFAQDATENTTATDASGVTTAAPATEATTTETKTTETTTDTMMKTTAKKHGKAKHHVRHHHKAYTTVHSDYKGEVTPVAVGAAPTATPCATSPFATGAYVGFGVGSRINYLSNAATFNAVEGSIFGGYGMMWDQVYGALEIFAHDEAELSNHRNDVGSASSTWGYGISVLPGYMINDSVLGYLRLGVVSTRFSTGNNSVTGGQAGFGLQTALSSSWDLRGEYVYSFYNSIRSGNPKAQQFNLGLVYKFQA
jgi:opacity protein-like surface antigen